MKYMILLKKSSSNYNRINALTQTKKLYLAFLKELRNVHHDKKCNRTSAHSLVIFNVNVLVKTFN